MRCGSDFQQLLEGNHYRHDTVYIVNHHTEHSGLDYKKVAFLR